MDAMGPKRPLLYTHRYDSPIGGLHLAVDRKGAAVHIGFTDNPALSARYEIEPNAYACGELAFQLEEYFRGERRRFTIDAILDGTDFQLAVWNRLLKIPYGAVVTYGEIAQKIGRRTAARAVGNAVGQNPLPILIPCHRVVPASGDAGRYSLRAPGDASGAQTKEYLLDLERTNIEEEGKKAQ